MSELDNLDSRVRAIEERNSRVEADKAWETSKTRRVIIALLTYLVIALYLQVVVHISPWINAVVPTVAFMFSTLVFGICKRAWIARRESDSA
jgi:hypothetical protein